MNIIASFAFIGVVTSDVKKSIVLLILLCNEIHLLLTLWLTPVTYIRLRGLSNVNLPTL